MLGESLADEQRRERGRFARWLRALPWCDDEDRAHDGYLTNAWHRLLDSKREPSGGAWSRERLAWRRSVYWLWRAFRALQAQRARLAAEGAAASA